MAINSVSCFWEAVRNYCDSQKIMYVSIESGGTFLFSVWSPWFCNQIAFRISRQSGAHLIHGSYRSRPDRALPVALPMSGAVEQFRDVFLVTDFQPLRIVFLIRVAASLAFWRVLVLLTLLGIYALYLSIRPKLIINCCILIDEHIQKLGERSLSDFNHCQLILLVESQAEDGWPSAEFVLLRVSSLLFFRPNELWIELRLAYVTKNAIMRTFNSKTLVSPVKRIA